MQPAGVVLAAGEGRRFGGPKQLAPLDGRPLLAHAVEAMCGACDRVVVVLGARAAEIRAAVELDDVVLCPDWEQGPFASLLCGLAALADAEEVVVALGDQPGLTAERIAAVRAWPGPVVRARDGDAPSHPVVVRCGTRLTHDELRAAKGPDLGPLADVDVPEDLRSLHN